VSILRKWFGPSQGEVWRQLSEKMGATLAKGGFGKSDRVDVSHEDWTISLDAYYNPGTKTMFTRFTAPYVNPDGFRFTIYRHGFFSDLGKRLGMQDVEVGFQEFDENFVIKGNDESKLRALFSDVAVREQLSAQKSVHLSIESGAGWFRKDDPPTNDRLTFQVPGVIKDVERLEQLFLLMSATLDRLCDIGSAYAARPAE
jgi:hypothetical protein